MSQGEDADSKTEEATEKKIGDALEQGNTPVSRDVSTAFGVLGLLGALAFLASSSVAQLSRSLQLLLANCGALRLHSDGDASRYLEAVAMELAGFLTPLLLVLVLSGLAGAFVQGAPRLVLDRIMPDVARISPMAGLGRLFSLASALEPAKSAVKIAIMGGAMAIVASGDRSLYADAMGMEPASLPSITLRLVIHLVSVVAIAVSLMALADFFWTRFKWRRDLRMSRQELKEEFKQSEGDPLVKARMRSLAMDRSRRRMLAAVPDASFVIANPTHFAIALRYVREEGGAPMVLAKGKDLVALKIREVAEQHGVPVLERKELARAMYDVVEIDKMIPQEFYRPVAELIHFLERLSSRRSSSGLR
ncbi:EscU/YscU/HrcU family type III secretion system export apparatus switch protein [Methylocystis sp. IM3]|uniref:EscU/YscU/HrcU family type III secretion system export apparatus switch protein n=1 Tax=unclassified Methylocystis TaxID=2625913 RepID=UPI0030F71E7A